MTITLPSQARYATAAAAFRAAEQHLSACSWCDSVSPSLVQMCTDGARLVLDATATMKPDDLFGVLDAIPVGTADAFERAVRETVRTELHYWGDRMEALALDDTAVRRDAFWIREAGDVAVAGPGSRGRIGCLDETTARHMSEIARLRKARDEEYALRLAAQDWCDTLAYAVAPPEVIGRHGTPGDFPWGSVLDLITPAADVTALRAALVAKDAGTDPEDAMSPRRANEIRYLLRRLTTGELLDGEQRSETVDATVALDAALDLQVQVDYLHRRIRDLEAASAEATPDRMAVLRPEFIENASLAAVDLAISRARQNRTRWNTRVDKLQKLRETRSAQIDAGTWPVLVPEDTSGDGVAPPVCRQNRSSRYFRLTDPVDLGPHFHGPDGRCIYCGEPETDSGAAVVVPTFVSNADSVNRNVAKHLVHPDDPTRTLCPRAFRASPPLSVEDAALISLCSGCRRAATQQD